MKKAFAVAAIAAASPVAMGQFVWVVDSGNDVVHLARSSDGSIFQQNVIDINAAAAAEGYSGSLTPKEILQVGNELWVTDQVADRIWRFDAANFNHLGSIGSGGELNNIRGFEVVGDTAFIAQGSASDVYGEGVVTYNITAGAFTGSFDGGFASGDISYNDVFYYNGELLVSDSDSGNDSIDRYDLNGNLLGLFATSDGLTDFDFVQQLSERADGNLLAAGFSLPAGVYEFAPDGTPLGIVAGMDIGPRGAFELENGEILYTGGINLRTDSGIILGGSGFNFQYFTGTSIPAPGAAAAIALGLGGLTRRRR